MRIPLLQTWRDFREFVEAKRRKREPLFFSAKGAAEAEYTPRSAQGFANFRAALRGVSPWGQASEGLDRLEKALKKRHQVGLPLPRLVMQNSDRSLAIWWGGESHLMVRCFPDRFFSLIGGTAGIPEKKITTELIDALAFQHRIQSQ
jgi:hypothetical protein